MKFNGWPYCLVQYRVIRGSSAKRQRLTSNTLTVASEPITLQIGSPNFSINSNTINTLDRVDGDGDFAEGINLAHSVKDSHTRIPNSEVNALIYPLKRVLIPCLS